MPMYAMQVFLLPADLCAEIERIMNKFWWTGGSEKGIHWRGWGDLCKPKAKGGFRRLREFNVAMLAKQAWRLFTEPNTLVARVYQAKYYQKRSFLESGLGSNPSFIWRSICEAKGVISEGYRWSVGNGQSIKVWTDPGSLTLIRGFIRLCGKGLRS
ncbi:unnamed protein product [Cuscuta epithymum]|uniref:Uncharacterized protein n=1 Tax=Cuscuta epithymum TaxID=186058 RepID=A0AAV0F9M5_9ASTE|nr:unnamed protein product [Cuscuta epithymum]